MPAHVGFLNKYYAGGTFLVLGRKVPARRRVILAGESREQIEAIMRQDPFCARGLAEFRMIQFRAVSAPTIFSVGSMDDRMGCASCVIRFNICIGSAG